MSLLSLLDESHILIDIKAQTKEEVIAEMVDFLYASHKITDKAAALEAVLRREKSISTGMRHGLALPHGKTDSVQDLVPCIAISNHPIEFNSLDGKPCTLFIMTLSPTNKAGPHLQFLAEISSLFKNEAKREALKKAKTPQEALALFKQS